MKRLVLLAALLAPLAAQTPIEPRFNTETLPAGGLMQIRLDLTSPHPITTGGTNFEMDSAFDGIEGVALFSPAGDAYGVALLQGQRFMANFVSPQGSLGTQLDYPFLVVASKIRSGLAVGSRYPISLGPGTVLTGSGGEVYTFPGAKPGSLTIGGTLSVTNVVQGGGLVPAGTTIRLLGTGFVDQTRVTVGETAISNVRFVSSTEMTFTVAQASDLTGHQVRVRNPSNAEVIYYSYLRAVAVGASSRSLLNAAHPVFPRATATGGALAFGGAGLLAVALQNSGSAAADVQLELLSAAGAVQGRSSVNLPPGSRWVRSGAELFGGSGASVRVTSSQPIQMLGLRGDEAAGTLSAFLPGSVPVVTPVTVAPTSLSFDAANLVRSLTLGSSSPQAFTAVASASWLTVSPGSGTVPGTVTVMANPAGLAPGSYSGSVTINGVVVPVSLTVAAAPVLTVAPTSLSFDGANLVRTLTLGSSSPQAFTAVASVSWLTVSPSSGTAPGTVTVTANPAGLTAGVSSALINVSGISVPVSLTITPTIAAVAGAASQSLLVALTPGQIITLYGANLGPAIPESLVLAGNSIATTLAEVQVLFNDIPAPLLFVGATQINTIVPSELAGNTATVQVVIRGSRSAVRTMPLQAAAPALFTQNNSGQGPVAALNQDYTVNTAARPAARGAALMLYATGGGLTNPTSASGSLTPATLLVNRLPVTVTIAGRTVETLYAGSAPGLVTGLLQINVLLPADLPVGPAVPVVVTINGVASSSGTTVSIESLQ
ncbi:MAG: IPT/TIG domain-containing protein [Acidobacteria bacterium]|nr:IPT/TIG domain-containing protein [Acidobacteriota bacterium]